ncbi:MAG: cytochrome P450 [Burkholderiales bacterium]|nr:cytochrome P450 [Burkholderiales bacterium]
MPTDTATALRRLQDLPGPRGWPVLGNLPQIEAARFHLQLGDWAREYGRFYQLRMANRRVLVCADHEAVSAVLRDRPDGFRRTDRLEAVGTEMGLKPGLFGVNGDVWKRQRRMVMAAFDPGHVKAYYPSLVKCGERLAGRWERAAVAGQRIDLQADLMRFTVDAIAGLAFGTDVNTLESDEDVIQRHLDKIFPQLFTRMITALPIWRVYKRPVDRELDRALAAVNQAIDGFIAAARQRLHDDPKRRSAPHNLLEAMVAAADEPGSGIDDAQVAGNVLTMLLAGEDTTANTLAWCIWLLHGHPAALARARDEVLAVRAEGGPVTLEQLARLDYAEACMHETMRLKPVAPQLPLQALKDTVVGDVAVPAGTVVISLLRHDSVDDRFVPDGRAFRPERWLGQDGLAPGSAKRISMPFGAGPRICPGRYLALQEMKMVLLTLLSRFDITFVGTEDGREPAERLMFAMAPVGLGMRLRLRG